MTLKLFLVALVAGQAVLAQTSGTGSKNRSHSWIFQYNRKTFEPGY
jgi:hypothetical protein